LDQALCPFVHLRELDLDGGQLTGSLPRFIATCFPKLRELDLSYNQLSGPVPPWVTSISGGNLLQFKVENNSLTGPLPVGLGNMTQLRVLWLANNNLQGTLPIDLAHSRSLISIDLRGNSRLCGLLPPGLHVEAPPGGGWRHFCEKAFTEGDSNCSVLTQNTGLGGTCVK
jgi:Leucine-rich repeat (LRR) protein